MFIDYLILVFLLRLRGIELSAPDDDFEDEYGLYQEPQKPDLRVIH